MKDRIEQLFPGMDMLVTLFTLACVFIDIDKLGYDRNFNIFDTQDQQVMIKNVLRL